MVIRNVIFVTLSLLVSCAEIQNPQIGPNTIHFDIDNVKEYSISEVISDIKIIALETNKNSVCSNLIIKLIDHQGKFYLLDRKELAIYVFTEDGKFVEKIKNPGKGPGEFYAVNDINFNPFTGILEIMTPQGKMIGYDPDKKSFETLFHLPEVRSVHKFVNISKEIVLFYSNFEPKQFIYYSREKKAIMGKSFENQNIEGRIRFAGYSPFHKVDNKLQFLDPYAYDVYSVDSLKVSKVLTFDFGKYNLIYEDLPEKTHSVQTYVDYLGENSIVFPIVNYIENEKIVGMVCQYRKAGIMLVYDKESSTYYKVGLNPSSSFLPFLGKDQDQFYGICLNAEKITEILPSHILDAENRNVLQSIQEGDNPVLIKYKLKTKF